jgi:hypothetical protein
MTTLSTCGLDGIDWLSFGRRRGSAAGKTAVGTDGTIVFDGGRCPS